MQLFKASEDPVFLEACAETCQLKAEAALSAKRPYTTDHALCLMISLYNSLLQDHGRTDLLEQWAGSHVTYAGVLALYGRDEDAEAVATQMKEYLKAHHEAELDRFSSEMDQLLAQMQDHGSD
jgi:hypothetical protein